MKKPRKLSQSKGKDAQVTNQEQQACEPSNRKSEVPVGEKRKAEGRKPGKRGSGKRKNREPGVAGGSDGAVNKKFSPGIRADPTARGVPERARNAAGVSRGLPGSHFFN